ncbi:MAG: triphosphoribosyl-dephospho-CoA synthase [Desulfurococcales archaeon]|nr:triphosphoribosyl-dephospho-CoA synthase [Desulfurococcales archaeon]
MPGDPLLALAMGALLEPLAHPKPGAVTRCLSHSDKDVFDFAESFHYVYSACQASAIGECKGFMARGIREYLPLARARGNIQAGTLMLLLPLCRAVQETRQYPALLREASRLVIECDSPESARLYYRLLEEANVSHLGVYEGPVPGVGSGRYPGSLWEALWAARWDLVHRELLYGYPLVEEAVGVILGGLGAGWEEAILWALLRILARHGDTLIAHKYGWMAYKKALWEARLALRIASGEGVRRALEYLDGLWRPRGWSPGAALDIVAAATGVAYGLQAGVLVEG